MAKMFYTLEEVAEKLGVSEGEVREMAASGKLQQFRDRDKLMFKRQQIDDLAKSEGTAVELNDESSGPIALASSGDTDAIDLREEEPPRPAAPIDDTEGSTGISVFETGEVEAVDPGARTQVEARGSEPHEEDLNLESVGSGSGLLDLTRESDDTSLGAELLDEIYPGGEVGDSKLGSAVGSSGVFESAIAMGTGITAPSGLENLQGSESNVSPAPSMLIGYGEEQADAAGSGFGAGMLIGATIALIIGLIVAVAAVADVYSPLAQTMTQDATSAAIWFGGLLVLSIILGVVGGMVGKAASR